jgi:hypothetical protein
MQSGQNKWGTRYLLSLQRQRRRFVQLRLVEVKIAVSLSCLMQKDGKQKRLANSVFFSVLYVLIAVV